MFNQAPKVEFIIGSNGEFKLLEDLIFTDHCGVDHIARKGDSTDGGTIPLLAQFLFKSVGVKLEPFGIGFPAFIIHDAECRNPLITRKEANDTLKEMMEYLKMPSKTVNAIYTGVEYYRVLHNIP